MNKKFLSSFAGWLFFTIATVIVGVKVAVTYELSGSFLVLFVLVSLFIFLILTLLLVKIFKNRNT